MIDLDIIILSLIAIAWCVSAATVWYQRNKYTIDAIRQGRKPVHYAHQSISCTGVVRHPRGANIDTEC